MMKKILLFIAFLYINNLSALETQTVHSSANIYYEMKEFSNSKQKSDGVVYGVGSDVHYNESEFRFAYEKAVTNTIQPPLTEDLNTDKIFLREPLKINF